MSFNEDVKGHKTEATIAILRSRLPAVPRDVLVVGCGSGAEAGKLARAFGANTFGIDAGKEFTFDHAAAEPARLRIMDARHIAFAAASFDLVYSFHALEHIHPPQAALAEMARVLRPGGTYFIGTPNQHRLVGYVNAPTSLANKLRWNRHDLMMRIRGRWSNEAGAHAGFTAKHLRDMCMAAFGGAPQEVSDDYYRTLYGPRVRALAPFKSLVYPCIYVAGTKPMVA